MQPPSPVARTRAAARARDVLAMAISRTEASLDGEVHSAQYMAAIVVAALRVCVGLLRRSSDAADGQAVDNLAQGAEQEDGSGQHLNEESRAALAGIGHVAGRIDQAAHDPDDAQARGDQL